MISDEDHTDTATAKPSLMTVLKLRPKAVERARPTAQAYDLSAILRLRRMPGATQAKPAADRKPLFQKLRGGDPDNDPFMQRLARLN